MDLLGLVRPGVGITNHPYCGGFPTHNKRPIVLSFRGGGDKSPWIIFPYGSINNETLQVFTFSSTHMYPRLPLRPSRGTRISLLYTDKAKSKFQHPLKHRSPSHSAFSPSKYSFYLVHILSRCHRTFTRISESLFLSRGSLMLRSIGRISWTLLSQSK